ncbi:STAS domain-containing protein [bacterium]|nr:STAS domain-containing protein [bacterium]
MEWVINKISDEEVGVFLKGKVGIDHEKLKEFEQELQNAVTDNLKMSMDCEGVEYINSFAIRTMVVVYKNISSSGGKFEMINVNDQIYELFEMLGLIEALNISKK